MSAIWTGMRKIFVAICEETAAKTNKVVSIANLQLSGTVSLSPEQLDAVGEAGDACKEAGAKSLVLPLKVSFAVLICTAHIDLAEAGKAARRNAGTPNM